MKVERSASRMASTTVVAAALHALALLGLALTRPLHPAVNAPVNAPDLVPVTLEAIHEPGPARGKAPLESSPPARAGSRVRTPAPSRGRAGSRGPRPADAGEERVAGPPRDLGSDPSSIAAPAASAPAASAPAASALPPPLLPLVTPAPSAVFGTLMPSRAGVSPSSGGAQILGAVRAVAQQGAPRNGHGTIRIEVDAAGAVTRVTCSSPSWDRVARSIQASLAGRRLRVPSGARGLAITMAVDADVTRVPPVITGETKATPCSQLESDQVGRSGRLPDPGCVDALGFLPLPRHRVSVKLVAEQAL
jgi:hypothetical protein